MVLKVAVAGVTSASIGEHISRGLVNRSGEIDVLLLVRSATLTNKKALLDELIDAGAVVTTIDDKSPAELAKDLAGVDTVVSAVSGESAHRWQLDLVEAARLAGVRTFVPSEFGFALHLIERGAVQLLKPKYAVRDAIRAAGMRPVFITTGFFYEWAFTPNLFDWQSGKVTIYGSGDQKVQLASVQDIAAWLPDVLLDPKAAAETDLVGEVLTWNEVVAVCEDATGKKLEVTYVPKAALERTAALPRTPENFWNIFGAEMALVVESGIMNTLKPGHPEGTKPAMTVREYFASASGASTAVTA